MKAKEFRCLSVPGGWVTAVVDSLTGEEVEQIGPVFRKIKDLWAWQRDNLYKEAA